MEHFSEVNIKSEPIEEYKIPVEMEMPPIKPESYSINTEVIIKSEPGELDTFVGNEFPVTGVGNSYELYSLDNMKFETLQPDVKIECGSSKDNIIEDLLEVSSQCKDQTMIAERCSEIRSIENEHMKINRQNYSEAEIRKEEIRKANRERNKRIRDNLSDEQKEILREKRRESNRKRRENIKNSPELWEKHKAKNRERRANLSPEKLEKINLANRQRQRKKQKLLREQKAQQKLNESPNIEEENHL